MNPCKLIIFLLIIATPSLAQPTLQDRDPQENVPRERFVDRLYIGGGFGLQFGTQTYIEIAPVVGYRFTERFSAGPTFKYIYYKFDDSYYQYSSHIYGGGVFARFFVLENLFLHSEYEVLSLEVPDYYHLNFIRKNVTSVLVGGGYRQMIGARSAINLMLLYNINDSRDSPYDNPIFRIGFGFGL